MVHVNKVHKAEIGKGDPPDLKHPPRSFIPLGCLVITIFILSVQPVLPDEPAQCVLIPPLMIHSEKGRQAPNEGITDKCATRIGASAAMIREAMPADPAAVRDDTDLTIRPLPYTCWNLDAAWTPASANDEKGVNASIHVG